MSAAPMPPSSHDAPPPRGGWGRVRPPGHDERDAEQALKARQVLVDPQPLLEQPAPPEGKSLACPQCGADLAYSPGDEELACRHCGYRHRIPQNPDEVKELDYNAHFQKGRAHESVMAGVASEVRCTGCGAITQVPANVATDFCPFCGRDLENALASPEPIMAPGGIHPGALDQRQARGAFRKWIATRWFAPNDFKHLDDIDRLAGLYVPFWTYDAMTFSVYSGARGDYYYTYTGSGKNRRRVRHTRWTPTSGRLDHFFDDVAVCASKSLPENLVTKLGPWNLKKTRRYDASFLAGFRSERYSLPAVEGYYKAREVMDDVINSLVRQRIGGDTQRVDRILTEVDGVKFKLILLPLWLSAYRYKDKTYRVAINAQTGNVTGERPWSWIKITLAFLAGLALLALLLALMLNS